MYADIVFQTPNILLLSRCSLLHLLNSSIYFFVLSLRSISFDTASSISFANGSCSYFRNNSPDSWINSSRSFSFNSLSMCFRYRFQLSQKRLKTILIAIIAQSPVCKSLGSPPRTFPQSLGIPEHHLSRIPLPSYNPSKASEYCLYLAY